MKYPAIGLFASALFLASCFPKADPVEYNDRIVARIDGSIQAINGLESTFESYEPGKMDSAHRALMVALEESVTGIKEIEYLGDDSLLKKAAESTLAKHLEVARDLYPEYISLLKVPDSLFTPELQTRAFEVKEQIDRKNAEAQEVFINAQATFGKEYRVEFDEPSGEE